MYIKVIHYFIHFCVRVCSVYDCDALYEDVLLNFHSGEHINFIHTCRVVGKLPDYCSLYQVYTWKINQMKLKLKGNYNDKISSQYIRSVHERRLLS